MLVTITMNPALDVTTDTDTVRPTHKLRCHSVRHDAGGGGINVAKVAHVLGAQVVAIFPAGGVAGETVCRLLDAAQVPIAPVQAGEATRESISVNELCSRDQYRFVLPGPRISEAEQIECLQRLREVAAGAEFVVASGSLPPSVPADFHQRISDICGQLGTRLIVDSSGPGLAGLRTGAFLIKPSLSELRAIVSDELPTIESQAVAARTLIAAGRAENVVVSMGGDGALLVTADAAWHYPPLRVAPGSGVGAGDAMVAGIATALARGETLTDAVALGMACGAAMLLTPGSAACTRTDVTRLLAAAPAPRPV